MNTLLVPLIAGIAAAWFVCWAVDNLPEKTRASQTTKPHPIVLNVSTAVEESDPSDDPTDSQPNPLPQPPTQTQTANYR